MNAIDELSSALIVTLRIVGSTLDGPHGAVLLGAKGIGGFSVQNDEEGGEKSSDMESFGAPGTVWRPREPEDIDAETVAAEAHAVRTAEGPLPLSWRDMRWHRNFPSPKPGTMASVGYAGGFFSWEDVDSGGQKNQRSTWYIPYEKNAQGVPQKAHVIAADPDGFLSIIHGDGYAVVLDKDNGITNRSSDGKSYTQLKGGAFSVVADTISLQGNVSMGANTAAAIPLLPGVASQPTTSVFFSP